MSAKKVGNWFKQYIKEHKNLIYMFIGFGILYLILVYLFRHFDISQEKITGWISQFGAYSIFALFLVQFIGSITPIPDALITAVGFILFGPFLGALIIFLGMYTAGCVHFLIAKKLGREFIVKRFPEVGKFGANFNNDNVVAKLTFIRMFTLVSFDVGSYVAGVSNVKFWQFTLSFFLGIIPHLVSYGFIAQGLLANGSPLTIIPGLAIFLIMFLIANWPKKDKINNT